MHLDNCNSALNYMNLNYMKFGFRKNYCTETAVLHFTEKVRTQLDKGGVVAGFA